MSIQYQHSSRAPVLSPPFGFRYLLRGYLRVEIESVNVGVTTVTDISLPIVWSPNNSEAAGKDDLVRDQRRINAQQCQCTNRDMVMNKIVFGRDKLKGTVLLN